MPQVMLIIFANWLYFVYSQMLHMFCSTCDATLTMNKWSSTSENYNLCHHLVPLWSKIPPLCSRYLLHKSEHTKLLFTPFAVISKFKEVNNYGKMCQYCMSHVKLPVILQFYIRDNTVDCCSHRMLELGSQDSVWRIGLGVKNNIAWVYGLVFCIGLMN